MTSKLSNIKIPKRHSIPASRGLLLLSLAFGIGATGVWAQTADSVNWYIDSLDSGLDTHLFAASGLEITTQGGFLFQLIADPGTNTDFAALLAAGAGATGWAIGNEHPSAADYGTADDIVVASGSWLPDNPHIDYTSAMTNAAGSILSNTPFYFRWFNTGSAGTATEAGVIYRVNDEWMTGPASVFPLTHVVPLDYGIAGNLGSSNTIGIAGWQAMPRALLTAQGTPIRWFVDHGITLAPSNTWDDADTYDSDTNGILNRAEYIAGTDPTDPTSVLKILDIHITPAASNWITTLTWHGAKGGAPDTLWHLYAATNGIAPPAWQAITDGTNTIPSTGTNTWTHQAPGTAIPHFYRIQATTP